MRDVYDIQDEALKADMLAIKDHLQNGEPLNLSSEELEILFYGISKGWMREHEMHYKRREAIQKAINKREIVDYAEYDACNNFMCLCNGQSIAYETVAELLHSKNQQKRLNQKDGSGTNNEVVYGSN